MPIDSLVHNAFKAPTESLPLSAHIVPPAHIMPIKKKGFLSPFLINRRS